MPNYNSNPNQKSITVHKEQTNNECENNYYAKINLNALHKAMSSLTAKAFELWIYMSKNQDNHFFWLSKVDFLSWSSFSGSSYNEAVKELISLGYLVQRENEGNHFDFYEIPKEEELIGITVHKEN